MSARVNRIVTDLKLAVANDRGVRNANEEACHRDFSLGDYLLRNCALDEMVRIGDNGLVQILGWFSGSKSRDAF